MIISAASYSNSKKRGLKLVKSAGMSFVKGVGTGIAAGMIVTAVGSTMMKNKKNVKKSAGKAAKVVSSILDDVQYMLK